MDNTLYLLVYLPVFSIFLIFYIMVLVVIFRNRKDRILGSTFFAISFYLGVIEIATFPINHFFLLMPNNGILVDEIYTRIGGFFPYLCSYSTFSVNTIQYMVISVCSFNRFVVIVGSYSRKDFFDKITLILSVFLTVLPILAYTPVFFTTVEFVDYRINATDIQNLTAICRCLILNKDITNFANSFLLMSRVSNVILSLLLYIVIFSLFFLKPKNKSTIQNEKHPTKRMREFKISIAIFIHCLIAATSSFLLCGILYIWPSKRNDIVIYFDLLEDINRVSSPILLMIFSKQLRIAFIQIYFRTKSSIQLFSSAKILAGQAVINVNK